MSYITEDEMIQLESYHNHIINPHIENPEKSIQQLVKTRGEVFKNAIAANNLNAFETILISGYADFVASPLNNELRSLLKKNQMHFFFMNSC